MRKEKRFNKFKKVILTVMSLILLVFSMPVKSEATIIADFVSLLLKIPDGIMWVGNMWVADRPNNESVETIKINEGDDKDEAGSIYNFYVTPYDIFTNGEYRHYIESNTQQPIVYQNLPIFYANFFKNGNVDGTEYSQGIFKKYGESPEYEEFAMESSSSVNSSRILRPVISNAYTYLRNLAIVLMMVILLYIGIRIMVSSVASDQSKYKQMIIDWVVGLALLFIMHYIMSFILNFNDVVVEMLRNDDASSYYISFPSLVKVNPEIAENEQVEIPGPFGTPSLTYDNDSYRPDDDWYTWFDDYGERDLQWYNYVPWGKAYDEGIDAKIRSSKMFLNLHLDIPGNLSSDNKRWVDVGNDKSVKKQFEFNEGLVQVDTHKEWGDNGTVRINARIDGHSWDGMTDECIYKANLMEYVRTLSTYDSDLVVLYSNNNKGYSPASDGDMYRIGLGILYLALVIETVMFAIIYFKRLFLLAYLTMIAPIVALMYPLDKVGDGKAQAFNTWLKDYIFNALLQPLHILLYTVFITAATDLFSKNMIYALVIYGFMISAEKYFKKLLGFDKASTGGGSPLAGALGGMMAMRGFDKLAGLGPHGRSKKGGSSGSSSSRTGIKMNRQKTGTSSSGATGAAAAAGTAGASAGTATVAATAGTAGSRATAGTGTGTGASAGTGGRPVPSAAPGSAAGTRAGTGTATGATAGTSTGTTRSRGGLVHAGGKAIGRGISRALTGGKYDGLHGLSKQALVSSIGGNIGRRALRGAGRIAGTATLGAAGLAVGAATAMATGDISNLTKGAIAGAAFGYSRGGGLADWSSDKIENAYSDISSYYGLENQDYAAKQFQDDAIAQFHANGVDLSDEDLAVIKAVSPYKDLKGDEDLLAAYSIALKENGGVSNIESLMNDKGIIENVDLIEQSVDDVSLAKSYGDLKEASVARSFIRNETSGVEVPVEPTDDEANARIGEIDYDEARRRAEKERSSKIEALERERSASMDAGEYTRLTEEIKNARRTGISSDDIENQRRAMAKEKITEERKEAYAGNVEVAKANAQAKLEKMLKIQKKTRK